MKLTKPFLSLLAVHQCNGLAEVVAGKGAGWLEKGLDGFGIDVGPAGAAAGVISAVVGGASYAYGKYKGMDSFFSGFPIFADSVNNLFKELIRNLK